MNNFNASNNVTEASPYASPTMPNGEAANYYGNGANFNQGQNFNQGNLFGQVPAFNQGPNSFYSQVQNMAVPKYQNQMPNQGMISNRAFMQGPNFNNAAGSGFNNHQAVGMGAGVNAQAGAGTAAGYGDGSDYRAGAIASAIAGANTGAGAGAGYNRGYGKQGYKSYNSRYADGNNSARQDQGSKKIAFNIERNFGAISEPDRNGWTKEFTFTSWSDHPGKYDIRCWSPDHTSMQKGLNFSRDELAKLYVLISKAKEQDQALSSLIEQELEREYQTNAALTNSFNNSTPIVETYDVNANSANNAAIASAAISAQQEQGSPESIANQANGFSVLPGAGTVTNGALASNVVNTSQEVKVQPQLQQQQQQPQLQSQMPENKANMPSGEYILLRESNAASNIAANNTSNAAATAANVAPPKDDKVNKGKRNKGNGDFFYSATNNLDSDNSSDMAVSVDQLSKKIAVQGQLLLKLGRRVGFFHFSGKLGNCAQG